MPLPRKRAHDSRVEAAAQLHRSRLATCARNTIGTSDAPHPEMAASPLKRSRAADEPRCCNRRGAVRLGPAQKDQPQTRLRDRTRIRLARGGGSSGSCCRFRPRSNATPRFQYRRPGQEHLGAFSGVRSRSPGAPARCVLTRQQMSEFERNSAKIVVSCLRWHPRKCHAFEASFPVRGLRRTGCRGVSRGGGLRKIASRSSPDRSVVLNMREDPSHVPFVRAAPTICVVGRRAARAKRRDSSHGHGAPARGGTAPRGRGGGSP